MVASIWALVGVHRRGRVRLLRAAMVASPIGSWFDVAMIPPVKLIVCWRRPM